MVHPMDDTIDMNPLNEIEDNHLERCFGTINEDSSHGRIPRESEGNQTSGRPKLITVRGTNITTHGQDPGINSTQTKMNSSLVHMVIYRGAYGK
jgi:hypothetical protein